MPNTDMANALVVGAQTGYVKETKTPKSSSRVFSVEHLFFLETSCFEKGSRICRPISSLRCLGYMATRRSSAYDDL